jgi:KaiC/GvpD/RAD55 family RecA-like ATPase
VTESGGHTRTFAITGLGGMGKTQTALQFMFENLQAFQAVLWVPADTRAKLIERLVDFGVELGLIPDRSHDQGEAVGRIKRWLSATRVFVLLR